MSKASGMEGFPEYGFCCFNNLSIISLPEITRIEDYAFYGCRSLRHVVIPNSVTSIGSYAFAYCGFTSVTIPNSVTRIGDYAFGESESLISITIPNSVTNIGQLAFFGCSALASISVARGNTKYDSRDRCNAIIETATNTFIAGCKNSTIPNGVTSIRRYAFGGCSDLPSVTIPSSVTNIGESAFAKKLMALGYVLDT